MDAKDKQAIVEELIKELHNTKMAHYVEADLHAEEHRWVRVRLDAKDTIKARDEFVDRLMANHAKRQGWVGKAIDAAITLTVTAVLIFLGNAVLKSVYDEPPKIELEP